MPALTTPPPTESERPTERLGRSPGDAELRRAWWSLALFPVSFLAAFMIGEGLFSWLDDDLGDPAIWVIVVAGVPALAVFALPALLTYRLGRRAIRLGRADGMTPAIIAGSLAAGFVGVNVVAFAITVVFG